MWSAPRRPSDATPHHRRRQDSPPSLTARREGHQRVGTSVGRQPCHRRRTDPTALLVGLQTELARPHFKCPGLLSAAWLCPLSLEPLRLGLQIARGCRARGSSVWGHRCAWGCCPSTNTCAHHVLHGEGAARWHLPRCLPAPACVLVEDGIAGDMHALRDGVVHILRLRARLVAYEHHRGAAVVELL